MARPQFRSRSAVFPREHVVRNPFFMVLYWAGLASSRLRALVLGLPPWRLRMFLLATFAHRLYEDWNEGRLDRVTQWMDPEVELQMFMGLGTYYGRHGVIEAWNAWREAFPGARMDMEELVEVDGELVTVVHLHILGSSSGIALEQVGALSFAVRDGLAVLGRAFATKAEALEAVGLREQTRVSPGSP